MSEFRECFLGNSRHLFIRDIRVKNLERFHSFPPHTAELILCRDSRDGQIRNPKQWDTVGQGGEDFVQPDGCSVGRERADHKSADVGQPRASEMIPHEPGVEAQRAEFRGRDHPKSHLQWIESIRMV